MAAKLPCKQISKSDDLYFLVSYLETVILCMLTRYDGDDGTRKTGCQKKRKNMI